jgi:hypothetical protein
LVARWTVEGTTVTLNMEVPVEAAPRFTDGVPSGEDMDAMAQAIAWGYLQALASRSPSSEWSPEPSASPELPLQRCFLLWVGYDWNGLVRVPRVVSWGTG